MRIGSGYNYILSEFNMRRNQKAYSDALTPLSTGKRLNKLSDDPTRLPEFFSITQRFKQMDGYLNNISLARSHINTTDTIVGQMSDILQESYELVLQGNDQSNTTSDITNIGSRLSSLQSQFLSLANTRLDGKYIFSGYETSTQPFSGDPVVYNGDANALVVQIGDSKTVQTHINGDTTFGPSASVDVFDTLDDLRVAILAQDEATVATKLADLKTGMDAMLAARATLANSSKTLDNEENFLSKQKINLSERMSVISDVDIAAASTELSFREYTLQSSMSLSRRIFELQSQSMNF